MSKWRRATKVNSSLSLIFRNRVLIEKLSKLIEFQRYRCRHFTSEAFSRKFKKENFEKKRFFSKFILTAKIYFKLTGLKCTQRNWTRNQWLRTKHLTVNCSRFVLFQNKSSCHFLASQFCQCRAIGRKPCQPNFCFRLPTYHHLVLLER